jgi:UDP-N-acetylglucosamine:LPS N-acetylglucosamine transferase
VVADDLRTRSGDVDVEIADALEGLGRLLRFLLLHAYRWQLRAAPWTFGLLYILFSRLKWMRTLGGVALGVLGGRSLCRFVQASDPDLVVSTYPPATAVLGQLKSRRRVACPVHAVVTDIGGLAFWIHPSVEQHYVMDESCVAEADALVGVGRATCVSPLVGRDFFDAPTSEEARHSLAVADGQRLIVVSGGGWGVGDLDGAVRAALTVTDSRVICLAGRSEKTRTSLQLAFARNGRVSVWGFTDRMSALLAAADVLVHSTGGMTCLEALASGCSIVAYGAPPGHARLTARTMSSLGLVREAKTPQQLSQVLQEVLHLPGRVDARRLPDSPSAAALLLTATLREHDNRLPVARPQPATAEVAVDIPQ